MTFLLSFLRRTFSMAISPVVARQQRGGRIRNLVPVLALSLMSACVTYRVQPSPDLNFHSGGDETLSVDELNRRLSIEKKPIVAPTYAGQLTEATFCSEPILTVLTLGIVPKICRDTYTATLRRSENDGDGQLVRDYEIKSVNGWLALLLLPLPNWKYGYEEDWGNTIKLQIAGPTK